MYFFKFLSHFRYNSRPCHSNAKYSSSVSLKWIIRPANKGTWNAAQGERKRKEQQGKAFLIYSRDTCFISDALIGCLYYVLNEKMSENITFIISIFYKCWYIINPWCNKMDHGSCTMMYRVKTLYNNYELKYSCQRLKII